MDSFFKPEEIEVTQPPRLQYSLKTAAYMWDCCPNQAKDWGKGRWYKMTDKENGRNYISHDDLVAVIKEKQMLADFLNGGT